MAKSADDAPDAKAEADDARIAAERRRKRAEKAAAASSSKA